MIIPPLSFFLFSVGIALLIVAMSVSQMRYLKDQGDRKGSALLYTDEPAETIHV